MDSPEINRNIRFKKDEREESHVRTFTKWINSKLSRIQPKLEISDLYTDLCDGNVLISLLEILTRAKLPREKGKLRVHHVTNTDIVLKTLEKEKVKLYGISGEAIADGNHKSTLGLVWSIILHYQVQGAMKGDEPRSPSQVSAKGKPATRISEAAVEDKVLRWVQGAIEGYDDEVKVNDLSKSWRDGMAFNVLIHVHRDDLFKLDKVEQMSNNDRLEHAFNVAEEHLNVQKLLEPSDVNQNNPDKKLVMMYVSSLYESLRQYEPIKRAKRRKVVEESFVASASSSVEASIPDLSPSEPFVQFKTSLVQTSTLVQTTESDFATIQQSLKSRIDVEAWENYEARFQTVESDVEALQEQGITATNDSRVPSFEGDEIQSDLRALEARWSSLRTGTESQRERIISFQNNEEKELQEWHTQAGIFRNWVDTMDDQLDNTEAMKSQDDINVLGRQTQELKRIGQAVNSDQVPRKVLEFGRSLIVRNVLSVEHQSKVKEQILDMEKELESVKLRVGTDIDRLNSDIDTLKQTQTEQLAKWRKQAEAMCDWLDGMEDQLEALEAENDTQDIKRICKHLEECENLQEIIKNDQKPHLIVEYGEALQVEKILSKDQKAKIEKQLKEMSNEWKSLLEKAARIKALLADKREASELEEKHKVEEWIRKFEVLLKQMTKVKESITRAGSLPIFNERQKAFQNCVSVVESIKPKYQEAVECAQAVISSDACPDWERSQVIDDVDLLKTTWIGVLDAIDEEQKSINETKAEAAGEQIEKIQIWREKYREVDKWYEIISPKVEGNFTMGKTLPVVRKQIAEQEEISNEMVMTHDTVEYLLSTGQELLQDPNSPEAEKNKLRKDIANLVERWESLSNTINNRMQRLSEMEKHFQENLAAKLEEWSNQANSVEGWLTKGEKKFQAMGGIAPNLEVAMKQKPRAEAMSKEMKQEEKKLSVVLRLGGEILADASLSEEVHAKLQQELNTLKNRWEALDEKINWRIQRLNETISRLGSQQDDKLEKWRENATSISDWLDKAQLRLAERSSIGSDLKSVGSQKEEFQIFLDESLLFQRHIHEFTEFGENLRTDPCISEEQRVKVQQKTKSLNERWDVIVQQINSHHNAVETRMDELEEKHQNERLAEWKTKSEPLQKWLTAKAIEAKSLRGIGDDILTVQRQHGETKVLKSRVENYGKQFREILVLADEIQKDSLIEDEKAKAIMEQGQDLTNRWSALNHDLEGRIERLSKKEKELLNEKLNKVTEWGTQASLWKDWLKKKEGELESQGPVGTEPTIVKKQKIDLESLIEEIKLEKTNFDEVMTLADEVLAMKAISDEDRRQIQQDKFAIKSRWDTLHDNIDWKRKRLGNKETELDSERLAKIQEWKSKATPLQEWLKKVETKCDALQSIDDSYEAVTTQINQGQILIADIEQKEKQLNIILRLGEDVLQSSSLSDDDRTTLRGDSAMLKERWGNLTENVQSSVKSLLKKKNDLEEVKRARIEEWRATAAPIEEWLAEESNKFDAQGLAPGANLDLVKKKRQETEIIFNEMLANEKRLTSVVQLNEEIQKDPSLSVEDKRKVQQEMNKIKTTWKNLEEKMETVVKRITNKESDLEKERENHLAEWLTKRQAMEKWMEERENKLQNSGEIAQDLDSVRKQIKSAKGFLEELHTQLKEFRILSRFGDEAQTHPSLYEQDRETVRDELTAVKTRWRGLEENMNDRLKRLAEVERSLLEQRTNDLAEWKDNATPVKDWISKQEKKIQSHGVTRADHDSVVKQRDEVEAMSEEAKIQRSGLVKLESVHEKVCARPSLSDDDKKKLQQDLNSIKNNWSALEENINQTHKRICKQESNFHEERVVKIEEWRCKSAPLEQLFNEQGSKWEDDDNLVSSDLETLRKYKLATQVDVQTIQKQQVELENAIRLGDEVQKHVALRDEDRSKVRMEISSLKSKWQSLEERMHKKLKRLSSKEIVFNEERSNRLVNWRNEVEDLQDWLAKEEKRLTSQGDPGSDLESMRKHKIALQTHLQEVQLHEKQLQTVIEMGTDAQRHASMSEDDRKTIQQDITLLENSFKTLTQKIEERLKRVLASEKEIQDQKDIKLEEWRNKLAPVEDWLALESKKLETDSGIAADLYTVTKQRKEMEDIAKEMELQEKKQLAGVIRFGDDLKTHVTLSADDRRMIQEDVESLKSNWENLREKMDWKIKRLSEKEKDLKEQESAKLQEWKNAVTPLQEWLSKEEQKLQSRESLATDMTNLRRQNQEDLALSKELELQQKRVANVASFGEEIAQHPSVSEEHRKHIEQCIVTVKHDWERLNEKVNWRLASADEKMKNLEKERTAKLREWSVKQEALQSLLTEQENVFKVREGIATDLETVKYKKSEVEDMLKELELEQKKELNNIIQFGEDVFNDPSMSSEDNRKIKQEIGSLKNNLENLEEKMKWRAKRLSEKEKELEQFRVSKLAEWKTAANDIQQWLVKQDAKFQSFDNLSNDLDEVRQQKTETETLAKEMETEKNELNIVVQMGDQLLEHPSLFEDDKKQVEQQLMAIQTNWDALLAKITKKVERITSKEAELDIEVTRISMEWRNKVSPLREWISHINKTITEESNADVNMDTLRKQKTIMEAITNDMQEKDEELSNVVSFAYQIQENPLLSVGQKGKIQEDSTKLKQEWDDLETAIEEKTKRLNGNLRNYEQEQHTKLSSWREMCKPLSGWLDQAEHVLSFDNNNDSDIETTRRQRKKVEALLEETTSIGPKFVLLKETADSLQQDPCLSQEERNNLRHEAENLSRRYLSVVETSRDQKSRLEKSLEELESQYRGAKLAEWDDVADPLTQWIKVQEQTLESLQEGADDLSSVRKQQEEAEVLASDVSSYNVEVESVLNLNDKLCEDPLVQDEAADVITMQAKNIKNKWRNLNEKIQARSESLSMKLTKLLNERHRRLAKWNDKVSPVADWLAEKQEMLASPETASFDIDSARKQKNEIVDLIVDLETQKESLEEIGRVDIDILFHPSIPEEERKKLKQDLVGLQNTADNLIEKGQRRAERLKETVKALGAEQKEKLGEWKNKMKEITNALNNAEKVVTEKSVVGADIATVKSQKETFQGVLARCMEFQNNIYEFSNLGDNLRADPCISGEEKVIIATTTDALNKRWDLVLAQLKTRSKALEEQLEVLEENHKTELFNRWEEKYTPFSLWLNGVENEIKSLKDIANNAVAVRKQQEETKILMSKVANQESAYKDVISLAQTINDDPLIEDSDATTIDKLASSLDSKWDTVNETLNTRSDSLRVRESFLSEQEQHLLHEWRRNVQPFNNWLSKVEEDGAYELNGNVGVNSIRDYSVRFKTLEREVEGRKPVLEEIEKLGGKLIADVTVRDEEKGHIQEEMEILQERWGKLHVKIHDNTKWADIKLIELAKKEQETLHVWKKNVEPFNAWLEETNSKLEEIQNNNTDTENLEGKHASLQRIKEDVTRHEEALARIVTIVGKLTDDDNLSETEKGNIKAEMNRLQDKWNTTQNSVNLNYLSVTEALMELAQKERATLERWKKQTDPFKEWIVEAKGRLDNILHPREEYDAVLEQKEKLENLSREIVDKEEEFGNICQLKDSVVQDDHLSNSFKDNIRNEGESFDQKWKELCDSVSAHSDRTQRQMVSLDDSQRSKLEKWQNDFKILTDQHNETESELKTFETVALDVDKAKKQISDLKVVEQKVEITRSRVEEVSSFCTEISSDSNISKKEKTRIKKDMELVKERQTRHEKATVEHQRRLDIQIRELQDQQSAKLEKWKTSSQPLHEWLDGIEDDAKEYDVMGGSIAEVQVQFDELQKLVKEFKETESDLFNVLKLGEELSTDPHVSQDVRESVAQDITFLKEDHQNVDELLKFQREKMKSQLLKLQQHQEKCLIDWNQRKSSADARVKTMEKRTGQFKPVGDDMDEVRSQKDDIKTTEKELESIEWELATVLEYGETLCKDKSIFDEEKEVIRTEMDSMETALNSSRNNVEERKLSLNSKMDELRRARANEFLTKWRTSSSAAVKWMESCEEAIHSEVDDRPSLVAIRERLDEIDELSDKIDAFEPEFSSTVKCGEDVVREPSVDGEDKEKVETELSELKERWKNINLNLDDLMNRMEDQEVKLSKQHDQDSAKWYEDVQETRDWCKETQTRLKHFEQINDHSNYDELSAHRKELQIVVEMLPKYQDRVRELAETSQELSRNSKNKTESENFIHENEALQKDFNEVKQSVESSKSNHDAMIADLETVHGQKLSEWNKKGERIEQQLVNIESKWQPISHLEKSNDERLEPKRPQLQDIVSDLNNLQPDYDRHCSVGHQLSKDLALSSDTRMVIEQKLSDHAKRWETLQISRRLLSSLPRFAVVESVVKLEEKQVQSAGMDSFDDLFGIDSNDGSSCQELVDWRLEYDAALKWCTEAEMKVEKLRTPGEYIVLVDRQHEEIEGMIQTFTSYETTVSKILDKGQRLLTDADSLRLSMDERTHLEDDLQSLKTKWNELQEKAFDTERSLNEHLNKLQEFQAWTEKASALSQWLEITHGKLDCCSSPSEDLDEKSKQKLFLQKFVMEKHQNEESINDVLNLGRYIVTNQLVVKDKHVEVNNNVKNFKDVWTQMLSKAEEFCKLFGVEFSHIDPNSSDPLDQWKRKVRDLEKWIADANDRLSLKKNLKDFSVLKTLPEDAKDISQGIDTYCVPQLNEITTKAQDILNSKKYNPIQNAEVTDTLARLSEQINDLKQYSESQKIHVRNATLAFFNEKLNASEAVVESVLEDLKKLKSVGTQASAVRDQVDLIKNSEDNLHKHLLEFEESKKQILEMEDKGYLSSDGFEGTLKVKTTELEPKLLAVEKQFSDTKNKLTKGVISFHGQHKDEVKKWLRYCERKLNEIDSDTDDVYEIYEAYCKLQELRREMIKGEQSFLNTLELNERLIAEAMLNEKQGQEYQSEIQAVAKWRNQLQRRIQEKDSRLYVSLVQGLNGVLMPLIHSFEVAKTTIKEQQLSGDFDTATEQMDGAKRVVESIEELSRQAQETLDLSQKITTMGILILKENDKTDMQRKVKELKEYCNVLPGKSREEFNRLFDEYLVLFKKEIGERKNWIAVSENRMSSNYYDVEDLAGFQDELREHKDFEQELDHRNMDKMADAAERVTELDKNLKLEVRNLDKRWKVLKQWADDYSLDLQRVVIEWSTIQKEQQSLVEWLDPHEEQISKLNEKINLTDVDGMKQQIVELKKLQSELEEKGVVLSNTHVKGMALMKFLNDEAAASRTIDQDLAQLDRRWNAMAKDILGHTELLRDIGLKQEDIKRQKNIVNGYIDETNTELDEHETKSQQLRGNISQDMIKENGETSREKKLRIKKEKEILRQDVLRLTKSLESKISDFPNYQSRVTRINDLSKDLEDASDNDSKVVLHEELVTFNARWQVIVTRLEDYSDYDLPDQTSWGCMGFVKRRLSNQL